MENINIEKREKNIETKSSKESLSLSQETLDFARGMVKEYESRHGYGYSSEIETYEVIKDYTSKGEPVQFEAVVVKPDRSKESRITPLFYTSQLKNSKGEVVGSSEIFIFKEKGKIPGITRGVDISKENRGKGYGSILSNFSDRVICDLDKKEEYNGIRHDIKNENLKYMKLVFEKMIGGGRDFDEDLVESLIQEAKRWEKIFVEKYINHDNLALKATAKKSVGGFVNRIKDAEFTGKFSKEEALRRADIIDKKIIKYLGDSRELTSTVIIQPKETYLREQEEMLTKKDVK